MIRFIDLGYQITIEKTRQFAWFDTISDKFLEFSENQVWDSWGDFVNDFTEDRLWGIAGIKMLNRFERLFQWKHNDEPASP